MKIIKLPVEYIRFLKSHNGYGWRVGYKRRNITSLLWARPTT